MEIHLQCTPKTIELALNNGSLSISFYHLRSKVKTPSKKVLVLTPFTVSSKRFLYLATALALNSNEVMLISSKNILRRLKAKNLSFHNFTSSLISTFSPDAIIACDVFYPILIPEIKQNLDIRFVFLRPFLFLNQFNPLCYIPLSIPWIYSLFMRIHPLLISLGFTKNLLDNPTSPRNYCNVLCLSPKYISWGLFRNHLSQKQCNVDVSKSKFSFRDYEGVIYGKIQNFISKASFSQ